MKRVIAVSLMYAILLGTFTSARAETHDPGVNHRQHRQHARIQQGVRSGELTRNEVHDLRAEQKSIRAEERAYRADGKLTRIERKDLHQDLHEASENIHDEKHDEDVRP